MTQREHHRSDVSSAQCAILTISDTRTPQTDQSGPLIRRLLEQHGHVVSDYEVLPDEVESVQAQVVDLCARGDIHALLINGGTGVAPRDTTFEAVTPLLEKQLDGFGELLRMLSFEQIGARAILTRAVAGVRGRTAVFVMPGSPAAVRLAMERLILPDLGHLTGLLASPP